MNRDRYGLQLTTVSDRAAGFYRDGVDRLGSPHPASRGLAPSNLPSN
jgi:hypothetical protein